MKKMLLYDRSWMWKARKDLGYTMTQVANACGVAPASYCRIENGTQIPNIKDGLRICDYLRVNPKKFLEEELIS